MVINVCIGALTPPVGACLFVASKIGKVGLAETSKEIVPMVLLAVGLLCACVFFPELVLFLPRFILGG